MSRARVVVCVRSGCVRSVRVCVRRAMDMYVVCVRSAQYACVDISIYMYTRDKYVYALHIYDIYTYTYMYI